MGKIENGKLLYHLTKLSNLDSIIEEGLASRRLLLENDITFEDVADPGIMDKRTEYGLDQYVPFHFHPYSSFDVAVKNAFSNEEFVYICIQRELARDNNFLILPKHPLTLSEVVLYQYDEGITKIDWEAMEKSSTESDYIHDVRMAECLTEKVVPLKCFHSIAVKNEEIRQLVQEKISIVEGNVPYINIQPWLNI
jgi:hypothetical protein